MAAAKDVRLAFELALGPCPAHTPSYQWLRDSIRTAILSGSLQPGQRLLGSRELAKACSVARGTALLALEDLKAEGYLSGVRGSGIYINRVLPEHYLSGPSADSEQDRSKTKTIAPHLSNYGRRLQPVSYFVNPLTIAFRTNLPALDLFPADLWTQTVTRRLRRTPSAQFLGCEPRGHLPLRTILADYLRVSRGVKCDVEQIMITSGIQESLDLVTRILINPGDRVLMEDPGYQIAVATLRTAGARVVPVPIDQYGVAPTSPSFAGAKLLYVTPGHQFPTGVTMPFSRRGELLHQARKTRTFIFEDDYDSEFRYAGSPIPSMQGVDRDDLLIFAGSFNKTLFPSLRMGYVVLPPTLVEPFTICKSMQSRHHPLIDQSVVCEFIEAGHFSRHLRRMRKIYAERLETLSYQVRKHLAGALELSQIEAGLQTVGWLTSRLSAEDVAALALQQNVDVVPLSRYCQRANMPRALQIGFAAIDEKAIAKGVQVLASVLTENAKRPGPLGRSTNWYR